MNKTKVLDMLLVLGGMSSLGLGVLAARAIAEGQGPSQAKAAPVKMEPVEAISPRYEHSAVIGNDVLMAEVARRSTPGEFPTIFYAPKAPTVPTMPSDSKRTEPKEPKLVLSSIMAGREPFAIIDGKLLRTGARVGDRWTIKLINPEAGSVTLESLDGETQELKLRR